MNTPFALANSVPLDAHGGVDLVALAAQLSDATSSPEVRKLIADRLAIPDDVATESVLRSFGIGFVAAASSEQSPRGCVSLTERDANGNILGIVLLGDDGHNLSVHTKRGLIFNTQIGERFPDDGKPVYLVHHFGPACRLAANGCHVVITPFAIEVSDRVLTVRVILSNGDVVTLRDDECS